MALSTSHRSPAQLTAEARAAAELLAASDALSDFLPAVNTRGLEVELSSSTVLPRAATFRAYDATARYGRQEFTGTRKVELPASSVKLPLGELAQLRKYADAERLIGEAMDGYAQQNGYAISARAVLARGELISTGVINLQENGVEVEIDFGRPAELSVASATAWSDPTATALSDIIAWQSVFSSSVHHGSPAVGFITSNQVLAWLGTNNEIIAAATGQSVAHSGMTRVGRSDVLSVLADYGLTEPTIYDQVYRDSWGDSVRPIAANKFILVPSKTGFTIGGGPLGTTAWGAPAEAQNPKSGIATAEQAGIFAAAYDRDDPDGFDVLASAIFLPTLSETSSVMDAVVGAE